MAQWRPSPRLRQATVRSRHMTSSQSPPPQPDRRQPRPRNQHRSLDRAGLRPTAVSDRSAAANTQPRPVRRVDGRRFIIAANRNADYFLTELVDSVLKPDIEAAEVGPRRIDGLQRSRSVPPNQPLEQIGLQYQKQHFQLKHFSTLNNSKYMHSARDYAGLNTP